MQESRENVSQANININHIATNTVFVQGGMYRLPVPGIQLRKNLGSSGLHSC